MNAKILDISLSIRFQYVNFYECREYDKKISLLRMAVSFNTPRITVPVIDNKIVTLNSFTASLRSSCILKIHYRNQSFMNYWNNIHQQWKITLTSQNCDLETIIISLCSSKSISSTSFTNTHTNLSLIEISIEMKM